MGMVAYAGPQIFVKVWMHHRAQRAPKPEDGSAAAKEAPAPASGDEKDAAQKEPEENSRPGSLKPDGFTVADDQP